MPNTYSEHIYARAHTHIGTYVSAMNFINLGMITL